MTKVYRVIILFICLLLFCTACSCSINEKNNSTDVINNSASNENVNHITPEVPDKVDNEISLEKKFDGDNFEIRSFYVEHQPAKQNLKLSVAYLLSSELNKLLSQNVDFYFQMQLPPEVQKLAEIEATEIIPAKKVENGLLSYEVVFNVKLKKDLNVKNIDSTKYSLYVLDQNKEPVLMCIDVKTLAEVYNSKHL